MVSWGTAILGCILSLNVYMPYTVHSCNNTIYSLPVMQCICIVLCLWTCIFLNVCVSFPVHSHVLYMANRSNWKTIYISKQRGALLLFLITSAMRSPGKYTMQWYHTIHWAAVQVSRMRKQRDTRVLAAHFFQHVSFHPEWIYSVTGLNHRTVCIWM